MIELLAIITDLGMSLSQNLELKKKVTILQRYLFVHFKLTLRFKSRRSNRLPNQH